MRSLSPSITVSSESGSKADSSGHRSYSYCLDCPQGVQEVWRCQPMGKDRGWRVLNGYMSDPLVSNFESATCAAG